MNSCVWRLLLIWMPNNVETICKKVGKKLRWPALHAIIIHCGTKSTRIAPLDTMTGPIHYVFAGSPTLSQFEHSDTQTQTLYFCIIEVYPVLIPWWVVYAILKLCWNTACFITLLRFTQLFYIAELYPILTHCWGITYLITLLSDSHKQIRCWAIPDPITLLRYSLS